MQVTRSRGQQGHMTCKGKSCDPEAGWCHCQISTCKAVHKSEDRLYNAQSMHSQMHSQCTVHSDKGPRSLWAVSISRYISR